MALSSITVSGVTPDLSILGDNQRFRYIDQLNSFQLQGDFVPTALIPSQMNLEFSNDTLSGFRINHSTTNTDTFGSLTFQSFVNAQAVGQDLVTFKQDGTINFIAPTTFNSFSFSGDLDMNSFRIVNMADPINPQDAATKQFVLNEVSGGSPITLTGAVTGTGTGTINTTLTDITTSQITDFNVAVTSFRLDEFVAPNVSLDMGTQLITNVLDPVNLQDAATKKFVENPPFGCMTVENNATTLIVTAAVSNSTSLLPYIFAPESRLFDMPVGGNLRCIDMNNYFYRIICTIEGRLASGTANNTRFNIRRNRGAAFIELETTGASRIQNNRSRVVTLQTKPIELQQNDTLELRLVPTLSTVNFGIINVSMYAIKL